MNGGRTDDRFAHGGPLARIRRIPLLVAVVGVVATAGQLYAHLALHRSSPVADERLTAVPEAVRLSFTESVEIGLSSITLTGPDGQPVALSELEGDGSGREVTARIAGRLPAGRYTVVWQAVGRDGHPVRGEFAFEIAEGAAGIAVPVVEAPAPPAAGEQAPPPVEAAPSFGPRSPLYIGARWLAYLGILGTLGALGFAFLLSSARVVFLPQSLMEAGGRRTAGAGAIAAIVLAASLPLRMSAQSHAVFGEGLSRERFSLILDTGWGSAWLVQTAATLVVLGGLVAARRGRRAGWATAVVGALALVVTPGLSGHAAAVESLGAVTIVADAIHVLGVGIWLGTLLFLVALGIPLVRQRPEGERGEALGRMVGAFSPVALGAGGVVVATGAITTLVHLSAVSDLWSTQYGRLLSLKLLVVAIVLGMGAINWRRIGPAVAGPEGDRRLARSAGAELVAATLVIALTAVLVAAPLPGDAGLAMENPQENTAQP